MLSIAIAIVSIGCGTATAPARSTTPVVAREPFAWEAGVFSLTLEDGVRLSMDGARRILRDDAHVATLETDGRVVAPDGSSIAALLPDGQISHRGNLTSFRIHADLPAILRGTHETVVRAESTDVVMVEGDALRVAHGGASAGSAAIAWGSASHERVRPVVALVVLLDLLEHPRRVVPPSLAVRGR